MGSIAWPQNIFGISAPIINDNTKIIIQTFCFNCLKPSDDSRCSDSVRGFTTQGSNRGENQKHFFHIIRTRSGSNPFGGEIFRTCPNWPWGTPSPLYNGYQFFPGGKAAGSCRWPPTPFTTEVKERVELYLYFTPPHPPPSFRGLV